MCEATSHIRLGARSGRETLLAGGSRELPSVMLSPSYVFRYSENATADRTASRGDIPGSRLLPTDRAADL
jgi:hypothetical protein